MRIRTLRARLTLWYSLVLATLLLAFSSFLYLYFRENLKKSLDDTILSRIEGIEHAIEDAGGHLDISEIEEDDEYELTSMEKYVQVMNPQRRVLAKSLNLGDYTLRPTEKVWKEALSGRIAFATMASQGKYPVRYAAVPIFWQGKLKFVILVGASLDTIARPSRKLLLTMLVLIPVALILAAAGGWFLADRALRPVDEITQMAQTITANNLHQRLRIFKTGDEIRRLADVFNEMIERLHNSFQQIRRFTADASHELRTPLTVLKGEVEVALRARRSVKEYQATLQSILEESNYMSTIVENLLLLSRIDAGQMKLQIRRINFTELVERTLRKMEILAHQKGVNLEVHLSSPIWLNGDPDQLSRMIINLVDNGIKYTPSGGLISVSLHPRDSTVLFSVVDTGIGIPEEDIPHIFERFYRVDKARSRKIGGSGLGLSIVQWIVESHGGKIEVESQPGNGSRFTVEMPKEEGVLAQF